jgi:transglutaminase-like putative cysteine protease
MRRQWTREAGMLGASLVSAYALARLATDTTAAAVVTAVVGTVVVAVLQRRAALAVAAGVVAVAVSALWWGLRATTGTGSVSVDGFRALRRSLQAARPVLVAFHLPLAHTAGITALCALCGGLAAVGGRALGIRSPARSLIPAAVLVVWSAVLLPTTGAALTGLVLGGCGFLVVSGDLRPDRRVIAAVAALSLGLAALTLGWSAVAGSEDVSPGGPQVPAVAPSALSLASDLTGIESRDANVVLFRARSRVPTYWQVTSLTNFVGARWVPDPATAALLHGTPPVRGPAPPPGPPVFTAGVTLSGYSGQLLPAPPSTVSVSGSSSPVVTDAGVVATLPVHAASTYTVTAVVPAPVSDTVAGSGSGPPASGADTGLGPMPAVIGSLAHTITDGQTTTLDKAEALVDYFRSGRFHYKVVAPQPGGGDPLVTFLTRTRTGSCEQFAGAFAVLARASGLPTRVAIGFTPGRFLGGVTLVRGSDAHAWPQVLIDGTWVSFEPTPQLPSGELSPPGVLGPAALGRPNPIGPGPKPGTSIPVVPTTVPARPVPAVPVPAVAPARTGLGLWWIALLLVLVVGAAVLILVRRARRLPIDRVIGAWTSIDRALARRSAPRPVWRTPIGHVRILSGVPRSDQGQAALEDMAAVATVLQDVTYGSSPLTRDSADRAVRAGRRARRAIRAGALYGSVGDGPGPVRRPDAPAGPGSVQAGARH